MADDPITAVPSQAPPSTEPPAPAEADGIAPPAAPAPAAEAAPPQPAPPASHRPPTPEGAKDVYREVAETVVFVVVLVLLLKTFVAEAFVIPTGSMATTLWGYQKYVTCPYCGYSFPVNCSGEADPQSERRGPVTDCECPNCRSNIKLLLAVEGKAVFARNNDVEIKFTQYDFPLSWKEVKVEARVNEQTRISVDGEPARLEDIPAGLPVRLIVDRSQHVAESVAGATDGNFGPIPSSLVVDPGYHSGDRVLVFKALYDTSIRSPHRHDVVVFKYPVEPQKNHTAMNYIKRLIGLSGETIAIAQGQLYVYAGPREMPEPANKSYWHSPYAGSYPWPDDPGAQELWKQGKFEIIRKAPDVILGMRRIVYDNDFQPVSKDNYPIRWTAETGWKGDEDRPRRFTVAEPAGKLQWLQYRHILNGIKPKPELITDFMGYNSSESSGSSGNGLNWVGDLILECDVQIDKVEANGELRLELVRGVDRFQARFNLQTGECSLFRNGDEKPLTDAQGQPATKATPLKGPGKYHVRLANVDERLTLWVNDALPFGDGVGYPAASAPGPRDQDLQPASIGAQGAAASVAHLQLWRDTYYTSDASTSADALPADARDDPAKAEKLRTLVPRFFYVQPGHYLCLGDNSPASSDGRSWGMVPERLMLGRALVVYFPFYCPYWPVNSPTNRVGPIR